MNYIVRIVKKKSDGTVLSCKLNNSDLQKIPFILTVETRREKYNSLGLLDVKDYDIALQYDEDDLKDYNKKDNKRKEYELYCYTVSDLGGLEYEEKLVDVLKKVIEGNNTYTTMYKERGKLYIKKIESIEKQKEKELSKEGKKIVLKEKIVGLESNGKQEVNLKGNYKIEVPEHITYIKVLDLESRRKESYTLNIKGKVIRNIIDEEGLHSLNKLIEERKITNVKVKKVILEEKEVELKEELDKLLENLVSNSLPHVILEEPPVYMVKEVKGYEVSLKSKTKCRYLKKGHIPPGVYNDIYEHVQVEVIRYKKEEEVKEQKKKTNKENKQEEILYVLESDEYNYHIVLHKEREKYKVDERSEEEKRNYIIKQVFNLSLLILTIPLYKYIYSNIDIIYRTLLNK